MEQQSTFNWINQYETLLEDVSPVYKNFARFDLREEDEYVVRVTVVNSSSLTHPHPTGSESCLPQQPFKMGCEEVFIYCYVFVLWYCWRVNKDYLTLSV